MSLLQSNSISVPIQAPLKYLISKALLFQKEQLPQLVLWNMKSRSVKNMILEKYSVVILRNNHFILLFIFHLSVIFLMRFLSYSLFLSVLLIDLINYCSVLLFRK